MTERMECATRNSNSRGRFYWGTLAVAAAACLALAPAPAAAKGKKPAPDLSGTWILNPNRSDNLAEKMRSAMEARRERMGGGGRGGYGGYGGGQGGEGGGPRGGIMQALLRQPDTLQVEESEARIRMAEPGRIPDIFYADGQDHAREVGQDMSATDYAEWKDGALRIDTKFGRGGKITESYATSGDGLTLTVTARLEPPRGDAIEVKSVYEKER